MTLSGWTSSLSVNNPTMDADHKKIFDALVTLHTATTPEASRERLAHLCQDVINHTETHFIREEKFLQGQRHPSLALQQAQHQAMLSALRQIQAASVSAPPVALQQAIAHIHEAFSAHILKLDKKYK